MSNICHLFFDICEARNNIILSLVPFTKEIL